MKWRILGRIIKYAIVVVLLVLIVTIISIPVLIDSPSAEPVSVIAAPSVALVILFSVLTYRTREDALQRFQIVFYVACLAWLLCFPIVVVGSILTRRVLDLGGMLYFLWPFVWPLATAFGFAVCAFIGLIIGAGIRNLVSGVRSLRS